MALHEQRKHLFRCFFILITLITLALLMVSCSSEQKILEGPPVDEALAEIEDGEIAEIDAPPAPPPVIPSQSSTPPSRPLPRSLQASTGITEIFEDVVAVPQQQKQPDADFILDDLITERNDLQRFSFRIINYLDKKIRPFIEIYAIDEETGNPELVDRIDIEEVLPRSTFMATRTAIKGSVDEIPQEISFRLMYVDLQKGKTMLDEEIVLLDASREFRGIRR